MTLHDHSHELIQIDAPLVACLIADQFPEWADLSVEPVEIDGHDNRTFRLGDQMSVRVPSGPEYAAHVNTEQRWLPKLAPYLPLPIPVPVAMGQPGRGLPWHWSINTWLQGESATAERIDNLTQFAIHLATFLNALQDIDAKDAPSPGPENFFRGGNLSVYDGQTRQCIDELHHVVDARRATAVWNSALDAKWLGMPVWIHGDVAVGNLLVQEGRLSAVIDFGQLAAGDPACDVTIAWTLFSGASRERFRGELAVDEATWARGRGWGLWKSLLQLRSHRGSNPDEAAKSQSVIHDLLSD